MRTIQREKILTLLKDHANFWIALPCIQALGVAQYNARIYELRRAGYKIENKIQTIEGIRHSWYRLVVEQEDY